MCVAATLYRHPSSDTLTRSHLQRLKTTFLAFAIHCGSPGTVRPTFFAVSFACVWCLFGERLRATMTVDDWDILCFICLCHLLRCTLINRKAHVLSGNASVFAAPLALKMCQVIFRDTRGVQPVSGGG